MLEEPREPSSLDDAEEKLEKAEKAGDADRLAVLEELHKALEQELDAGEAGSPGR